MKLVSEMKNTLDGTNNSLDIAKEKTGELKNITIDNPK